MAAGEMRAQFQTLEPRRLLSSLVLVNNVVPRFGALDVGTPVNLLELPDHKILAFAQSTIDGVPDSPTLAMARLLPDGTLDTSFGGKGYGAGPGRALYPGLFGTVAAAAPDDRFVYGGKMFLPSGKIDTSFNGDGHVDGDFVAFAPDGSLFATSSYFETSPPLPPSKLEHRARDGHLLQQIDLAPFLKSKDDQIVPKDLVVQSNG